MDTSYDVVIVGGGVVGSSIAYFLSANPDFDGSIAVIERDPSYTASSSSLSTSAIRQQFGTPPNIAMSKFSIDFLREAGTRLAVGDELADIGLHQPGYLVLAPPERAEAQRAKNRVQRGMGVDIALIEQADLARRFPWLNTQDLALGSFGLGSEGWFDGPGLMQAFRRKARAQGVDYVATTVTGLAMASPRKVGDVVLGNGGRISAGTVINAAGPWSAGIAGMAGVELPVVPSKRCVFVFETPARIENCPFVFDTSGFWLRPEGHLFLCGIPPVRENEPDDFGLDVDYDLFDELIWPALAHRVPGFEQLRMLRAWAGLYEYNTFDHSGIIGRHPEVSNFVLATGFSGHGMMHAAATGSGVGDLIAYGDYRSIDLSAFRYERIASGQPIEEHVY
ncbi:NAD(P)/FAD-dependent oxidoreductase [Labrys wisconsinensis]|uniref:Glycine/D-amino acid oxidase-like deaminating enzyme n=1 Tax=Labrys wisconsinensis TaxID=425677 RepID=A0ABU0J6U1_9HYPH|nr:FAD-binding oxidoreductase [Labrys wisconsinensis]MDQ0469990.1 glycine/D-amino acid oxidase-like deaminating enzyme [Labrys wisconsinensis]